jgi:hypothetical protein
MDLKNRLGLKLNLLEKVRNFVKLVIGKMFELFYSNLMLNNFV